MEPRTRTPNAPDRARSPLSPRAEFGVGAAVVLGFAVICAAVIGGPVALCLWIGPFGVDEGTPFGVADARTVVATQAPLLERVHALLQSPPLSREDPKVAQVAGELGALYIRVETRGEDPEVAIVYRRCGLPEIYETSLVWISPRKAARVRAGELPLGDSWQHIDGDWWLVWR